VHVSSFSLSVSVIEYQTLVLRGDLDAANDMLPEIPEEQRAKIARFLEGQGYKEQALEVATDKEHRFELALGLNQLEIALELARDADVEHKWKTVGDAALTGWDMRLAEECFRNAKDLGSLLLLYSSSANVDGLTDLANKARAAGQHNVAFTCHWQTGNVDACLDILLETNRTAEAVLFAQTYKPSRCHEIATQWKTGLEKSGKGKVGKLLGIPPPDGDDEMFPEWDEYLRLEKEGGQHGDLIDVNGGDDATTAKSKAAPLEDDDAEEDEEDDDEDGPTETET